MLLMTDIHVRSFTGSGIKSHLHSIAKLRTSALQDYPYSEAPNLQREMEHIRHISTCKEAIIVLIFDGHTLVGSALGYPLVWAAAELLKPFRDQGRKVESYFFFGESMLLKLYRGRGIGHHFFDAREAHVTHFATFQHICFCVPYKTEEKAPADFIPLNEFYRRRGYIHHPELAFHQIKHKVGQQTPVEVVDTFWIKEIHR